MAFDGKSSPALASLGGLANLSTEPGKAGNLIIRLFEKRGWICGRSCNVGGMSEQVTPHVGFMKDLPIAERGYNPSVLGADIWVQLLQFFYIYRLSSLHRDLTLCQPSISSFPPLCSIPSPRSTHS